jgi:hypothetical protein
MDITIGCDPELFILDGYDYISAYGILPGTKKEPYKVDKGAVQVDGMAFEFNIDPAKTQDEFEGNIRTVLTQMNEMVKRIDKNLRLSYTPFAKFDPKYFDKQPWKAKMLGCVPDFTSMGAQQTPPPGLEKQPFRTASGHVHIGWTEGMKPFGGEHFYACQKVASAFRSEKFFEPTTLLEKKRMAFYGGKGAFRPKSYGIELRAPSNRWVRKEDTRREMFNIVMHRFKIVQNINPRIAL